MHYNRGRVGYLAHAEVFFLLIWQCKNCRFWGAIHFSMHHKSGMRNVFTNFTLKNSPRHKIKNLQ